MLAVRSSCLIRFVSRKMKISETQHFWLNEHTHCIPVGDNWKQLLGDVSPIEEKLGFVYTGNFVIS